LGDLRIGVAICEDIWYPEGPSRWLSALSNVHFLAVINASPFEMGKPVIREEMIKVRARDNKVFIAYANLVGAQDELVFDGHSFIVDYNGEVLARAYGFKEALLIKELDFSTVKTVRLFFPHPMEKKRIARIYKDKYFPNEIELELPSETSTLKGSDLDIQVIYDRIPVEDDIAQVYLALVLGIKDYFRKTGFRNAVIGVSGGIDSALVTALAVDALGKENVIGVIMPSQFTSEESLEDASQLLDNLGARKFVINIQDIYATFLRELKEAFAGLPQDITEQNLQARIRGTILMAIANKYKALVLATSNKSEASVGYATLYGDTCGAIAPLKDVYKTTVYKLARYRNNQTNNTLYAT